MSLTTPEKIRTLQRQAVCEGPSCSGQEAEPAYRFYRLYDTIYRDDSLAHAWTLAKANKGARHAACMLDA